MKDLELENFRGKNCGEHCKGQNLTNFNNNPPSMNDGGLELSLLSETGE